MTIKQASKKTDFTVDLLWWGSLRLAPITYIPTVVMTICYIPGDILDIHTTAYYFDLPTQWDRTLIHYKIKLLAKTERRRHTYVAT